MTVFRYTPVFAAAKDADFVIGARLAASAGVVRSKTVLGFAAHGQPTVELLLRLPCRDRESFIAAYSSYVHDDRILLFTPSPIALGTRVRFTLCSYTGEPFLRGVGVAQGQCGIASEVLFGPLGSDSDAMLTLMAARRLGYQLQV